MDDYEVEERKQAAADALTHYSQFAMACIGQGVTPSHLRLHLLKELSGMPTTLIKDYPQQASPSTASNVTTIDQASSSTATASPETEVNKSTGTPAMTKS
ncbi:hypothetical protein BDL97_02G201800 [Sphagnum fallax]|uniref:Uncharacterized protein n=1 Tax=Sphagnum jensenii TaxID=128206 RepID=A0ABP0WS16_9BRYO|nr:hypothetical protein BDL97_02G201800 [Sphagnum fallax]